MTKVDPKTLVTNKDLSIALGHMRGEMNDRFGLSHKEMADQFNKLNDRYKKVNAHFKIVNSQFHKVFEYIDFKGDEIKNHFHVVAEKWFGDIAGANKDEREQMKDKLQNHERRIRVLEGRTGIIAV